MNPDPEFNNFVSAMLLGLSIIGVLLLLIGPKDNDRLRGLAISFFACGLGGVAVLFLLNNHDILADAQEHIALTLIGMVIATISVIRLIRK